MSDENCCPDGHVLNEQGVYDRDGYTKPTAEAPVEEVIEDEGKDEGEEGAESPESSEGLSSTLPEPENAPAEDAEPTTSEASEEAPVAEPETTV